MSEWWREEKENYTTAEKKWAEKRWLCVVAIDVQKSPHFYVGQLRITINVYIHQSNHQKTQTIGVNKKHKK